MQKEFRHYPMPTEDSTPDAVILANGEFPTHPLPLTILQKAKRVICCDGAANEYISRGFTPGVIVGDGDSLTPDNKIRFADIILYDSDTEINDLTKAVRYGISQNLKSIYIVGATGKREDHTIGNVSLLLEYMDILDDVMIISDYGVFCAIKADSTFEAFIGQPVSVFPSKPTPLNEHGLKYPLSTFNRWWQGTLNEVTANPFTIFTKEKVLVYRAY